MNLQVLAVNILEKLEKGLDDLKARGEDTEQKQKDLALFVLMLHSAYENFLVNAFKKLIIASDHNSDVKEYFLSKANGFSLNKDYAIFCCFFLPDLYEKSAIMRKMINDRNAYAHRMFNDRGQYIFTEKNEANIVNCNDFFDYVSQRMKLFAEEIENKINLT